MSKEILSGFGERVRKAREAAGFANQKKLAKVLGVATGTVGNWEAENNTPTLQQTAELARVLRISVDALLGESHGRHGQSLEQTIREIVKDEIALLAARLPRRTSVEVLRLVRAERKSESGEQSPPESKQHQGAQGASTEGTQQ